MIRIVTILLIFFSVHLNAQIQQWTKDEIIEKQFEAVRKANKIKATYNYYSDESWKVYDSTNYREETHYNKNGQKTVYLKYKTNWTKKIRYYQTIDSIFYNEQGVLTEFKRYVPKQDGKYYECTYRAITVINDKGLIERINYMDGYQCTEMQDYELRTYDKKDRLTAVTKYTKEDKEDYKWTFEYDKMNRISRVIAAESWGSRNTWEIKYNSKGLLASYTEFYETEKQNEALYTYDAQNRLTQRNYWTNFDYTDTLQYYYEGKSMIPFRTYFKYPPYSDSKDFDHEYVVYWLKYFD